MASSFLEKKAAEERGEQYAAKAPKASSFLEQKAAEEREGLVSHKYIPGTGPVSSAPAPSPVPSYTEPTTAENPSTNRPTAPSWINGASDIPSLIKQREPESEYEKTMRASGLGNILDFAKDITGISSKEPEAPVPVTRSSKEVKREIEDVAAAQGENRYENEANRLLVERDIESMTPEEFMDAYNRYKQSSSLDSDLRSRADALDREYEAALDKEFEDKLAEGYREASLWDLTGRSINQGYLNSMYGQATFNDIMYGGDSAQQYKDQLESDEYKYAARGKIANAVQGAANQLGQQLRQWTDPNAIKAGIAAAGGAAAIGQMGPQALTPEEVLTVPGGFLMGIQAGSMVSNFQIEAGFAYNEMIENGISEDTAKKVALAVGAGNAALEGLQLDELAKSMKVLKNFDASKSLSKQIGKVVLDQALSVGNETLQEMAQEGVTIAGAQAANMLEKGEWAYDSSEVLGRIGETGVSSLMTFGLLNLPGTAMQSAGIYAGGKQQQRYTAAIQDVLEQAGVDNSTAKEIAPAIFESVTDEAINGNADSINTNVDAQNAQADSAAAQTSPASGIENEAVATDLSASETAQSMNESPAGEVRSNGLSEAQAASAQQARYNAAEADPVGDQLRRNLEKSTKDLVSGMGDMGQKLLGRMFGGTENAGQYTADFVSVYEAAKEGRAVSNTRLNPVQVEAARFAAEADSRQNISGISETEDMRNGRTEEVHLRNGSERYDSENTGGQVRILEENAGRDSSGQVQARPADAEAVSLKASEALSTAGLGLTNGSDTDQVWIVAPGSETASMREARAIARQHGLRVTFFTGGYLTVGDATRIRGCISGDRVFVRADDPNFTSAQLMRHEETHKLIREGRVDLDEVRNKIEAKIPGGTEAAVQRYAEAYAGSGMTADEIFEEIVCDARADMNIFQGIDTIAPIQQEFNEAAKVSAEARESNQARAPDERISFSRDLSTEEDKVKVVAKVKENWQDLVNGRVLADVVYRKRGGRNIREKTNEILDYYKTLGIYDNKNQTVSRQEDNRAYLLDRTAVNSAGKHVNTDMEYSAIFAAPYVIRNGRQIFFGKKTADRYTYSKIFAGKVSIGGNPLIVAVVANYDNKGRLHAVRVFDISDADVENKTEPTSYGITADAVQGPSIGSASKNNISERTIKSNSKSSDMQFSMAAPIEESGDLVALHNLSADKLEKALKLGGFPMPSIAVTKSNIPHTNFGDITLVMNKSTVDPKASSKNTVYSADAWTPTFPSTEYEVNEKVASKLRSKYYDLYKKFGNDATRPLYAWANYADDELNRVGGVEKVIDQALDDTDMMKLYLMDQGMDVPAPVTEENIKRMDEGTIRFYDHFISALGEDVFKALSTQGGKNPVEVRKEWWANHGEAFENAYRDYMSGLGFTEEQMDNVLNNESTASQTRKALEMRNYILHGPETRTVTTNTAKTDEAIRAAVDKEAYDEWLHGLFDGLEKSSGIYNGKDRYTASGNRRSFAATHDPVTLENIAKIMSRQNEGNSRNVDGFYGIKSLRAGMAERFSSIERMHELEGRLQHLSEEEAQQISDALSERLTDVMQRIYDSKTHSPYDNSFIEMDNIGEMIMEATETRPITVDAIVNAFKGSGYKVGNELAMQVKELLFDVSQMPVNIFEAKPERAVRFDEVMAAIVPQGTDDLLIQSLKDNGVENVMEYEKDNDADRLAKVNSVEGSKFSRAFDPKNIKGKKLTTFPLYNESGSEANQIATRWAKSSNVDTGAQKLVSYHDSWYLIEKFDSADWGYQIVQKLTAKEYKQYIQERAEYGEEQSLQDSIKQTYNGNNGVSASGNARSGAAINSTGYGAKGNRVYGVDRDPLGGRNGEGNSAGDNERFRANSEEEIADEGIRFSRVADPEILAFLNNQPTQKVYRAMQLIDDKLYPPMAARVKDSTGKKQLVEASELGIWEQADERSDLIKTGNKFNLDKANGTSLDAAYNPYFHTSRSPLNDQFSSAHKRDNIVIVEGEIPESELTSGYKAQYAKDPVGEMKWHSGPVSSKLKGNKARRVILSRWFKPVRIVPNAEVAQTIKGILDGENISIPYNTVTPGLRAELEKIGVPIDEVYGGKKFSQAPSNSELEKLRAENNNLRKRVADFSNIKKELARQTERADRAEGQLKRTEAPKIRRSDAERLAKDLKRSVQGTMDTKELSARLEALGNKIVSSEALDYSELKDEAVDISRDLMESARELTNGEELKVFQGIKDYLKGKKFFFDNFARYDANVSGYKAGDAELRKAGGEIPEYASFKRHNQGRFALVNDPNAAKIDDAFMEMREMFGAEWFPEEIVSVPDMVLHISELLDNMEPVFENPYSYDMAEAIEYGANEILESLIGEGVRQTAPTYADKMEKKLERQRYDYGKKLAAVREQRDRKVADLKAHYREVAEAKRARREDSSARTRLLKIMKRLSNKKLDAVNRALLDQYIGDIDLVAKSITEQSVQKLSDLRDWYEDRAQNDPDFIRDERIEKQIARLSKKHISELSQDEVADLTEVLLHIENELRTEKKLVDSQVKQELSAAGRRVIADIDASKGSEGGLVDRYFVTETLSPERQVKRITGYTDGDPLAVAAKELSEGQRKMFDYQRRASEKFAQWTNDKDFIREIAGRHAKEIEITGMGPKGPVTVKITPAMRMSLYLHSLNDQNLRHIAGGGITVPDMALYKKGDMQKALDKGVRIRLTPSELRAACAGMSAKERAFAHAIDNYYNGMSRNEINAVSELLKGYSLAGVDHYFPILTDKNFLKKEFDAVKMDGTIEGMGFLKERINSASPIMLLDVNEIVDRSVKQHSKYVGLAIPVRNFNKLWGVTVGAVAQDGTWDSWSDSVQAAVMRKWGANAKDYVEKMMADVNESGSKGESWGMALSSIRSKYAGSVLTMNAGVAIKQAASYPTAAAVTGWGPLMKALKDPTNRKVDLDLIAKYTPLLWYRSQGFSSQELGDIRKQGRQLPKVLNWIQGMDVWTTTKLWTAAEYYVDENSPRLVRGTDSYYKAVAEVYNRIIEETQPNYTTMQRPQILRSGNELTKTLNMFKTQPFQNFNILYEAFGEMQAKRTAFMNVGTDKARAEFEAAKTKAARAVSSQLVSAVTFALMQFAWDALRGKDDKYKDDEDELAFLSWLKGMGLNVLSNGFGMLPYGGFMLEIGESTFDKVLKELGKDPFFDATYYGLEASPIEAVNNVAENGMKAIVQTVGIVGRTANGEDVNFESYARAMYSASENIAQFVGIPAANVRKSMEAVAYNGLKSMGPYVGRYYSTRLTSDPAKYPGDYYDVLYKAYKDDPKAYKQIYDLMLSEDSFGGNAAGEVFTEDKIRNAMETRMKKEQGVDKASELQQRYLPPDQQAAYDKQVKKLEGSSIWDDATDEQQKNAMSRLYEMTAGTSSGQKMSEKAKGGAEYGLDETKYILYQLALEMVDEPNSSGKMGTYTVSEKQAAAQMAGLSQAAYEYLKK